ncbi:MAG: RluA family pseudouridine synthase [Alphaproteobacteria bacterium]|nr:RluA family pseudouridine synthase [Alphaproteobacteria bacterium]
MLYSFTSESKLRLDDFLRVQIPIALADSVSNEQISNSKIRRLIVAGAVSVNGQQCRRPAFELRGRSIVKVELDPGKFFYEKQPDDISYEVTPKDVIFEDEYLICVNKPALFPTEETIVGNEKRDNLHDAVVRYLWAQNPSLRNPPYVGIMHRLDRETSGVILFTKQRSVNKSVQESFATHNITKEYRALCSYSSSVSAPKKQFTVEMFMNRTSPKGQACKCGAVSEQKGGLYSKTDFKLVRDNVRVEGVSDKSHLCIVQAFLYTGRTHQIRTHLSFLGLPILGDELYGGIQYNRIMLHAQRLVIEHPVSKISLELVAPLPEILK